MQYNAPAYTSQVTLAAWTKSSFEVLLYLSDSPDLAPFGPKFPNLKTNLPGKRFGSNEGVIDADDDDEYLGTRKSTS